MTTPRVIGKLDFDTNKIIYTGANKYYLYRLFMDIRRKSFNTINRYKHN